MNFLFLKIQIWIWLLYNIIFLFLPRSRQAGLLKDWPQVVWYFSAGQPEEERECWCRRCQARRNVNEQGGKAECMGCTLWKASQHWVWVGPWSPVQQTTVRRPAYPNHYWHGEESHLEDEVWQSCRSIWHSGGDDQEVPPWSTILLLRLSMMARSQLSRSKVSLSAFTRAMVMLWTEATIEASSWQNRPWRS